MTNDLYTQLGIVTYNIELYKESLKQLNNSKQELLQKIDEEERKKDNKNERSDNMGGS